MGQFCFAKRVHNPDTCCLRASGHLRNLVNIITKMLICQVLFLNYLFRLLLAHSARPSFAELSLHNRDPAVHVSVHVTHICEQLLVYAAA